MGKGSHYDPYGRITKVSGDLDADFLYTGHYYHEKSNLSLAWFRAYDADLGRWISRDPIGYGDGSNIYRYVSNNSINYYDPDGRAEVVSGTIILIAVVVIIGYVILFEHTCDGVRLRRIPIEELIWIQQEEEKSEQEPQEQEEEEDPRSPRDKKQDRQDKPNKDKPGDKQRIKNIIREKNLTRSEQRKLHDQITQKNIRDPEEIRYLADAIKNGWL